MVKAPIFRVHIQHLGSSAVPPVMRLGLLTLLLHVFDLPKLQVMSLVFCFGTMVPWLLNMIIWVRYRWYLKIMGSCRTPIPSTGSSVCVFISPIKIGHVGRYTAFLDKSIVGSGWMVFLPPT